MPKKILIVEDEALIGLDLEDALRSNGYATLGPARTVAEALALVEKQSVDAALVDIVLPDGSSLVVARWLRARRVPLAFISGSRADAVPREFSNTPFITKPCRSEAVVDMVGRLLDGAEVAAFDSGRCDP